MAGPRRLDVLAIGELNPDMILSGITAEAPVLGTEQTYRSDHLTLGSSTAITSVGLRRLGLTVTLASRIGRDGHGDFCLDALRREGVGTEHVHRGATPTGLTVSVAYAHDRLLLTRLGASAEMRVENVDTDTFASVRHVHSGSFFLLDALRPGLASLFAEAREMGCTTSLDPGWAPGGDWDPAALQAVLPHCDVFLPNRDEARAITGATDEIDALRTLAEMGARRVAMKAGAAGAHVLGPQGHAAHPGFEVAVQDTTGAGDAFDAGFVFGMLAGWSDAQSLTLANTCGAIATTRPGGTGASLSLASARALVRDAQEELPDA